MSEYVHHNIPLIKTKALKQRHAQSPRLATEGQDVIAATSMRLDFLSI